MSCPEPPVSVNGAGRPHRLFRRSPKIHSLSTPISGLRCTIHYEPYPWLVAAVIRQESAFDPRARSGADARGLMQLLPGSGRDIARARGIADFDPAMLWQPDVNLAFGMEHLAKELARYPELERSLAAYNAGPGRATAWSRTLLDGSSAGDGPLADPELFVERIPYLETRNYIRRITVNREVYRLLYGSGQ